MKTQLYFYLIFISLLSLSACQTESIPADDLDLGRAYYPVETGKYIEYAYDSLVYDDGGSSKYSSSGFIKEQIDSLLEETAFEKEYRLIKYWRKQNTDPWVLTDVETIHQSKTEIIRSEENLPFIRLVFPNSQNTRWNGNALFDENIIVKVSGEPIKMYQGWEYKVVKKNYSATIGQFELDSLLEVEEVFDDSSIFSLRSVSQVYARGIGPVYREMKIYDSQRPIAGKPWEDYAEKGFYLKQTMVAHN